MATMEIVAVEAYAFVGCNLITKITIPVSYKEIREGAFKNCLNLKEINVENIVEIGATMGTYTGEGALLVSVL